jgi:hypothetical protein
METCGCSCISLRNVKCTVSLKYLQIFQGILCTGDFVNALEEIMLTGRSTQRTNGGTHIVMIFMVVTPYTPVGSYYHVIKRL